MYKSNDDDARLHILILNDLALVLALALALALSLALSLFLSLLVPNVKVNIVFMFSVG